MKKSKQGAMFFFYKYFSTLCAFFTPFFIEIKIYIDSLSKHNIDIFHLLGYNIYYKYLRRKTMSSYSRKKQMKEFVREATYTNKKPLYTLLTISDKGKVLIDNRQYPAEFLKLGATLAQNELDDSPLNKKLLPVLEQISDTKTEEVLGFFDATKKFIGDSAKALRLRTLIKAKCESIPQRKIIEKQWGEYQTLKQKYEQEKAIEEKRASKSISEYFKQTNNTTEFNK